MAIKKKKSPQASSAATPSKKKKSAAVSPVSKKKSSKKKSAVMAAEAMHEERVSSFERPADMEPVHHHSPAPANSENSVDKPEGGLPVKAIVLGAVLLAVFVFVAKDLIFPGKKESGNPPVMESTQPAESAPKAEAPAPAPAPEKAAPVSAEPRTYTVKAGDNLMRISASQLGDAKRYNEILELNKDTLKSASALKIGMTLKIPAK